MAGGKKKKEMKQCSYNWCRESASVNDATCGRWKNKLPKLNEGYQPGDIFNTDETGLLLKCLPDIMLSFKGDL